MTRDEIVAELGAVDELPDGRAKTLRLESLAQQARTVGDPALEAGVLLQLSDAYTWGAEAEKQPLVVGRLLRLLDEFPRELEPHGHTIHWTLKWMTSGLVFNPEVPLATIRGWLDELESRYRQQGYSLRPVHAHRAALALHLGDASTGAEHIEASIIAPRDEMSNCQACERGTFGGWRVDAGDDEGALEQWAPVLDGTLSCKEEPHRVLSSALLPLVRLGRLDEARGAFLRGYPLVRRTVNLLSSVGHHLEFCALTGNEARGLEILTEHGAWLTDSQIDTDNRVAFLTGATVLLRRLADLGHDDLPVGTFTVATLRAAFEKEIADLAARFDRRNGNHAYSGEIAARLARHPLVGELPLGRPTRLPVPAPRATATTAAAPPHADATLEDLITRARRLGKQRHPDVTGAWARVAALAETQGQPLPPDVAAEIARHGVGELIGTDPARAVARLQEAAALFAAVGDRGKELDARAAEALTRQMSGEAEQATALITVTVAEAEAAFQDGAIRPRQYLNVRTTAQTIAVRALDAALRAQTAAAAAFDTLETALDDTRAAAEKLGSPSHVARCHELLSRVGFWRKDLDVATRHLLASRAAFLAADQPWNAALVETTLADLLLQAGDPASAESYARDAIAHAHEPEPERSAHLASLLAHAIGDQPGRLADLASASLSAAARWDGLSEPESLDHTFTAARVYTAMGRHAEAVTLFDEVIARLDIVSYNAHGVARTRQDYARALHGTGQPREAAEQYLRAARAVEGDPEQAELHAVLAWSAAQALRDAGLYDESLAAYDRAIALFAEQGNRFAWVRSQRSRAWLLFATGRTDGAERAGVSAMRAVLSELESLTRAAAPEELAEELAPTRAQLDEMLETVAREASAGEAG